MTWPNGQIMDVRITTLLYSIKVSLGAIISSLEGSWEYGNNHIKKQWANQNEVSIRAANLIGNRHCKSIFLVSSFVVRAQRVWIPVTTSRSRWTAVTPRGSYTYWCMRLEIFYRRPFANSTNIYRCVPTDDSSILDTWQDLCFRVCPRAWHHRGWCVTPLRLLSSSILILKILLNF